MSGGGPLAPAGPSLAESVLAAEGPAVAALHTMLLRCVQGAFAGTAGAGPPELAASAVEELVSLDARRPGAWFLLGLVRAYAPGAVGPDVTPPTAELAYHHQLGVLTGLVERGDEAGVAAAARDADAAVERLVGSGGGEHLGAPVLSALLHQAPGRVASLLDRVAVAFAGWEPFVGAAHDRAAKLLGAGEAVVGDDLLRAAQAVLRFWAGLPDDPGAALLMGRHDAELGLLRARGRRLEGDFAGAGRLLDAVAEELLDPLARGDAACERALVEAEVARVTALRFPGPADQRATLTTRLERGRAHVDAALATSPDHPVAHLLLGVLFLCRGDEAGAVRHLGGGTAPGSPEQGPDLGPTLGYRRAVAHLGVLEAATDAETPP